MSQAIDQLPRLLALIPYLQAHPGIELSRVAREFNVAEKQIRDDLQVACMCGLPGQLPGDLIEVDMDLVDEEGIIELSNADTLNRPLRLTSDEAASLVVALQALKAIAPASRKAAIASALTKLSALNDLVGQQVEVQLETGEQPVVEALTRAISHAERIRLTYDGMARRATTRPVVDPHQVSTVDGAAYLRAWDVDQQDWRTYRIDRIAAVEPTGELALGHGQPPEVTTWLDVWSTGEPLVLLVSAKAEWITEFYPVDARQSGADGRLQVTLRVGDRRWLRWLLLSLAPEVEVVSPRSAAVDAAEAARAALDAYRRAGLLAGEGPDGADSGRVGP